MLQIIHKPLTVILTCVNHFYGIHISLLMIDEGHIFSDKVVL